MSPGSEPSEEAWKPVGRGIPAASSVLIWSAKAVLLMTTLVSRGVEGSTIQNGGRAVPANEGAVPPAIAASRARSVLKREISPAALATAGLAWPGKAGGLSGRGL